VRIYELSAEAGQETPQQGRIGNKLAKVGSLAARDEFDAAAKMLRQLPLLSISLRAVCRGHNYLQASPPAPDWNPVNNLDGK